MRLLDVVTLTVVAVDKAPDEDVLFPKSVGGGFWELDTLCRVEVLVLTIEEVVVSAAILAC